MKLTKCENGHFYDNDKYPECPYCNTELQKDASIVAPAGGAKAAEKDTPTGPVTGWLVVLDGAARGRDLRLGEGRNFIGADSDGTPVLLCADAPLSARQAVVVYDPETAAFTLLPGTAKELCYLAGKAVLTPEELAPCAELSVAGAKLRFVPFCGEFRWAKPAHAKTVEKPAPAPEKAPENQQAGKIAKNNAQAKKPAAK